MLETGDLRKPPRLGTGEPQAGPVWWPLCRGRGTTQLNCWMFWMLRLVMPHTGQEGMERLGTHMMWLLGVRAGQSPKLV